MLSKSYEKTSGELTFSRGETTLSWGETTSSWGETTSSWGETTSSWGETTWGETDLGRNDRNSYRQVVTLKRSYVMVITLWVLPALLSAMWFWNPSITLWYGIIGIPLCLIISIFSYTKIFLTLRQRNTQIFNHVQQPIQTNQLNIARYKKAVSIAIWLQLTLVACYLPYGVASAFVTNGGGSVHVYYAWIYATTLVLSNSSINPILHCWKLEEVRQTVKDTISQVPCGFSS